MTIKTDRGFRIDARKSCVISLIFVLVLLAAVPMGAYSVLTHEAIIDSAWDEGIRPSLLKRFPNTTPDELMQARAYSYGGSTIQDMGYYPFGSHFFSDLVHYVRSGDFIASLLRNARDVNEYAFALGALAHYAADNNGHRIAVNRSVPVLYPKLQRKYGDDVTYAEDRTSHLRTEFAFDVLQVANGHYASNSYHDYIGFKVSRDLLERAFQETYSVELKSVFSDFDLAIGSYRRSVSVIIPEMTRVAWNIKKDDIQKETPGMTRAKFMYQVSRSDYEKQWDKKYKGPGIGTRMLAFVIRIVPKVGPLRSLAFHTPTPETERMFRASFNATLDDYEKSLRSERGSKQFTLVNDNFDTGTITGPGQYRLADEAYADLLDRLSDNKFDGVSPKLRTAMLEYYANLDGPFSTKKNKKKWATLVKEVGELKALTPVTAD